MKNNRTNLRLSAFSLLFCLTIAVSLGSGFSVLVPGTINCDPPTVRITEKSHGTVSFAWDSVSDATVYQVYYVREADNYTSTPVTTGNLSVTYSNLPSGTYDFYFRTICGGVSSGFIIEDDLIM